MSLSNDTSRGFESLENRVGRLDDRMESRHTQLTEKIDGIQMSLSDIKESLVEKINDSNRRIDLHDRNLGLAKTVAGSGGLLGIFAFLVTMWNTFFIHK